MTNYSFTLFTPCYNGAKTIERVFESVASQTYTNFQWIIINDGSTDKSDEVIVALIKKYEKLKNYILYIKQENQGKHVSWNKAIQHSTGDFFVPCDCDDSFVPETLSFFNQKANEVAGDNFTNSEYSGINVCCYDPGTGKPIGTPYPKDGLVSNNIELAYRYKIKGEHWGCIRTQLLRELPFPQIKGHFYNENYLWYSLAKNYNLVCYNKALRARFIEQNSLVHDKNAFYDKGRAVMWVHYRAWQAKHCGKMVFGYSKTGGVKMYYDLLKSVIKVVYLKLFH